jgi:hypothetical protein
MGQKQTSRNVRLTYVIPPKADIHRRGLHVRLVPREDMLREHIPIGLKRSRSTTNKTISLLYPGV